MDQSEILKELAASQDRDFCAARTFLESAGFNLSIAGSDARAWCIELAKKGNIQAAYAAAVLLSQGLFGPRDRKGAFDLCNAAAATKFPPAMLLLGSFYEDGWGVSHDAQIAVRLMREAADLGYGPAHTALGLHYLANPVNAEDFESGLRSLRQAAAADEPQAQATLAERLLESHSPERETEALSLMRRAAEQGFPHAHRMLGYYYARGAHGLPADKTLSRRHFDLAEELEEKSWKGLV